VKSKKIGEWHQISARRKAPANAKFIVVIAYSSSDNTGSFLVDKISLVQKTKRGTIIGKVFHDINEDGKYQSNENGIEGAVVSISPNQYYGVSDASGNYEVEIYDQGLFDIKCSYQNAWIKDILPHTNSFVIDKSEAIPIQNFAISFTPNIRQLDIVGTSISRARPGFKLLYDVNLKNKGTTRVYDFELEFKADPMFKIDSANGSYTLEGNVVKWNYDSLKMGEDLQQRVFMTVPANTNLLGKWANSYTIVRTKDSIEDNDTIKQQIRGSYDPNDKAVLPQGIGPSGYVEMSTNLFDYTIRFQNTGTDTAFDVVIADSLSKLLDIETFQTLAASHRYTVEINKGGVLVWRFENILLPDSNTNEPLSHGFVRYSIKPIESVSLKDVVYNTGEIYFDYNPPIVTNTTENTFHIFTNSIYDKVTPFGEIDVFPNPNNGKFSLRFDEKLNTPLHVELYALDGRLIQSYHNISSPGQTLSTRNIPSQMLIYRILNSQNESLKTGRMVVDNY
jgi:hypothetical protein